MATLWQDFKYGMRILFKQPGFTFFAVLMLAIGIGATTTIFSVVNSVLIRPFPYSEPDRLVIVWERQVEQKLPFMFASPPNYADWREQNQVFDEMAAFDVRGFFLRQGDENLRVMAARSTASLFSALKVAPMIGSVFSSEHDQPGKGQVVVLSHNLWSNKFAGDADIIGSQIVLDDQTYTVVGVMPPEFKFPPPINLEGNGPDPRIDLWLPFAMEMKDGQRGAHFMRVMARLKAGVSIEQANAEMNGIASRLELDYKDTNSGWDITLVPMNEQVLGETKPALLALLAAVFCVLLIACVNVANLLLARGAIRQREFAIRQALGAGRLRLIRQMLTESLILSGLGCLAGLVLASWGINALTGLAPKNIPRLEEAGIDGQVAGFAVALSLLTGLLAGLVPALQVSSINLSQWLKEGGRATASRARLRSTLVISEVALSLVLLVGASLLFQSFLRLRGTETGFDPANAMTMRIALPKSKFAEPAASIAAYKELEQRINNLPGVESAGFVLDIPLAADRQGTDLLIEGEPEPQSGQENQTNFTFVTPRYFQSMHVPVIEGRYFDDQDVRGSADVVIVNQTLARRFFSNESPVGKRVIIGFNSQARRIVGVVGDVRHNTLKDAPTPNAYVPYYQVPWSSGMSLVVRSKSSAGDVLPAVREQIRDVVGGLPIFDVKSLDEILSDSLAQSRFSTLLATLFSVVALLLASLGIYGFISFMVAQSTHEIGIRQALGARPSDIFRLVIGKGLALVLSGVLIGLVAAVGLTRFMSSLLFGISPTDAITFAVVSLLLVAVALFACYAPARRATRVDPMVALRYE